MPAISLKVEHLNLITRLLRVLVEYYLHLNFSGFGAVIGMNHVPTHKYLGVFENLFLIRILQPWYTNAFLKSPKLHFLDTGLLAVLETSY